MAADEIARLRALRTSLSGKIKRRRERMIELQREIPSLQHQLNVVEIELRDAIRKEPTDG
jgi:predicted  nucleic acid-binding Zn-ribbon protein